MTCKGEQVALIALLCLTIGHGGLALASAASDGWVCLGPELATVYALAIDPQRPTTLYAGTWKYGVYKSTDAGAHWSQINGDLVYLYSNKVRAPAVDPQTPATVFLGTYGVGVFKSTNGGAYRNQANNGLTNSKILCLTIAPQTPTTVYAGTNGGGYSRPPTGARTGTRPTPV
ncbi:MAG: hypothetical protein QHJ34_12925 [bacterium]|jgi:photosystem II stability/assembly factor-like uncharacterized protein|nr:hypothetical protein [candidate division KSB1 bacterium]MDH7561115.1 hypothetical protein [bacterium]